MKKAAVCLMMALLLAGCSAAPISLAPVSSSSTGSAAQSTVSPETASAPTGGAQEDILVVDEPFLDAQCRDILENPEDYAGISIRIEGMYYAWTDAYSQSTRHAVTRYCPDGCCGGGMTGLEIYYEGDPPAENEWVQATGVVDEIYIGDYPNPFPMLRITSLIVMETRGNEYVEN